MIDLAFAIRDRERAGGLRFSTKVLRLRDVPKRSKMVVIVRRRMLCSNMDSMSADGVRRIIQDLQILPMREEFSLVMDVQLSASSFPRWYSQSYG